MSSQWREEETRDQAVDVHSIETSELVMKSVLIAGTGLRLLLDAPSYFLSGGIRFDSSCARKCDTSVHQLLACGASRERQAVLWGCAGRRQVKFELFCIANRERIGTKASDTLEQFLPTKNVEGLKTLSTTGRDGTILPAFLLSILGHGSAASK